MALGPQKQNKEALLKQVEDPDISALKACVKALNRSTSPRMLKANLDFLVDRFLLHPSSALPDHLRPNAKLTHGPNDQKP